MITYNKSKYSVSTKYIGKIVTLETKANTLYIYYNKELIKTHKITDNYFNYHKEDLHEILKSDVFKHKDDKYIENFIENNLKIYDSIGD